MVAAECSAAVEALNNAHTRCAQQEAQLAAVTSELQARVAEATIQESCIVELRTQIASTQAECNRLTTCVDKPSLSSLEIDVSDPMMVRHTWNGSTPDLAAHSDAYAEHSTPQHYNSAHHPWQVPSIQNTSDIMNTLFMHSPDSDDSPWNGRHLRALGSEAVHKTALELSSADAVVQTASQVRMCSIHTQYSPPPDVFSSVAQALHRSGSGDSFDAVVPVQMNTAPTRRQDSTGSMSTAIQELQTDLQETRDATHSLMNQLNDLREDSPTPEHPIQHLFQSNRAHASMASTADTRIPVDTSSMSLTSLSFGHFDPSRDVTFEADTDKKIGTAEQGQLAQVLLDFEQERSCVAMLTQVTMPQTLH